MGSFTCIGYYSPIYGTDGLKSPKERLSNEDKAPCPRTLLPGRGSNWGPPVWKSEVLTARPRQLHKMTVTKLKGTWLSQGSYRINMAVTGSYPDNPPPPPPGQFPTLQVLVLMSGFIGWLWSRWGVLLVENCPRDSGPGGQ